MVCPRGAMCTIRLKVRVRVSVGSLGRDRAESSRTRRTARSPAERKVATRAYHRWNAPVSGTVVKVAKIEADFH